MKLIIYLLCSCLIGFLSELSASDKSQVLIIFVPWQSCKFCSFHGYSFDYIKTKIQSSNILTTFAIDNDGSSPLNPNSDYSDESDRSLGGKKRILEAGFSFKMSC